MIEHEAVSSSNIRSIGYNRGNQILEIEFHSGSVYQYFDVTEETWQGLMNAGSHGKYFNAYIKGHYHEQKTR